MVERVDRVDPRWAAVDDYIVDRLFSTDPALEQALAADAAATLSETDVSAAQGKLLHLMLRMTGASRILESERWAGIRRSGSRRRFRPGVSW